MNCVEEIEFAFDEMLEMPELDEIAFLDCEEEAIVDPNQLATEDPYCACEQSTYWASQHEANCNDVNVIYWYHPDYLGSVEAITDVRGEVYQFFHNTIWGDRPLRNKPVACFREGASMPRRQQDQKAFTYKDFSSRFCFNLPAGRHGGKERDEETGNYYYGARYYDPKISVWLSVDPMAAKRTWLTPYNFVSNNPLLRVDPDGNLDICETCPNEPRFDEYRDSPVNYEFTPNGNGGGEIHVAGHQTLADANVTAKAAFIEAIPLTFKTADYLSHSLTLDNDGEIPNPFYGADAIYMDRGASFLGSELDQGVFFILTGDDKGRIYPYAEYGVGPGTDVSIGGEIGRVDYSGESSEFRAWMLPGDREKTYLGTGGFGLGGGVARAVSKVEGKGESIVSRGVQIGLGASPFIVGIGLNKGKVRFSR